MSISLLNSSKTLTDSFTRWILAENISFKFFLENSPLCMYLPTSRPDSRDFTRSEYFEKFFSAPSIPCLAFLNSAVSRRLFKMNLVTSSQTRNPSFARLMLASMIRFILGTLGNFLDQVSCGTSFYQFNCQYLAAVS